MKRQKHTGENLFSELEVLQRSQRLNRLLLNNVQDIITVYRIADLSFKYVNPAVLQILGYTQEELFSHSAMELVHPEDLNRITKKMKDNLLADEGRYEFRYRKKDGTYIWLEVTSTIFQDESEEATLIIISHDVTERKNSEALLQQQAESQNRLDRELNRIDRDLKTVRAIHRVITQAENEKDLLHSVCKQIVELGGYKLAWVGYVMDEQQQKVKPAAAAGIDSGYLAKLNINLQDPMRSKGPVGTAIRTGILTVLPDLKKDNSFKPWLKDALGRGFKSSIAIPLMAHNKAFGSLCIYAGEINAFDYQAQKLLLELANDLEYAIISLRAHTDKYQTAPEYKKNLEKMQHILMQTVTSFGSAFAMRDPFTATHQKMVVRLSTAIAKEMGFTGEQLVGITVAGNIYDIGKLNIPNQILSKPGKLSDVEADYIKFHSQAGYDVIKDIEFPWPVAEIIMQHHERMDGSGYPLGLIGEEILKEARIMAVADVIAAMSSQRPYRPDLGIEMALEEISQNSGTLYDPEVTAACLRLFREKGFKLE